VAQDLLQNNTISASCCSALCPTWIKFDSQTSFITGSESEFCGDQKSKTAIYFIEVVDRETSETVKAGTWAFNFTCQQAASPINIDLPWPAFYLKNHLTYKYKMTPPEASSLQKLEVLLNPA
jgi:hypothetical protein